MNNRSLFKKERAFAIHYVNHTKLIISFDNSKTISYLNDPTKRDSISRPHNSVSFQLTHTQSFTHKVT